MRAGSGFRMGLRFWIAVIGLAGFCAAATATPAVASTATEIGTLPTLDGLSRNETPLSNGGKWTAISWDTATTNKTGQDTTAGWGPQQAFPAVHGAYWSPTSFSDAGSGDAATLTMQSYPEIESRYISVWLNMPSPDSTKSGYQLSWTLNKGLTTYTVKLSKWTAGNETVLASNAAVSIPNGTAMAITDTGGTVTAWKGIGGSVSSLLSAEDSAYSSGYAGIEASGNLSRSIGFRAGQLLGGSISGVSILDDLLRSEAPMVPGKWAKTSWAAEIGGAWNFGFLGFGSTFGATYISGAYWTPTAFSDAATGVLVTATVGTGPNEVGEYMAIWLNMPSPGSNRSGYEARFTYVGGAENEYDVAISKWVAGTRTVLASGSKVSIPPGTTYALTEVSGGLALWTGTSSFAPVLSASDSTYSSGYAGLEAYGPFGTEYNFRAGAPTVAVPPGPPSVTGASPAGPANNNSPKVSGSAAAGTTVKVYSNSGCTGEPVATGSNTAFASPGITVSVGNNTTTTFYATATNGAGTSSSCSSSSVTYVEDSIAPSAPMLTSTNPQSPANNNSPRVIGSAEAGTTIKLYDTANCFGGLASGTAGELSSAGIPIAVSNNTTAAIRATATDAAGNASACSSSISYAEDSTNLILDAGFENGLDNWNTSGMGEVAPTIITSDVRTGTHSAKFKLTGEQHRSELILGGNGDGGSDEEVEFKEGQERYYAFSFKILTMNYGKPGAHNLIMQFKSDDSGSPNFGLQLWDYEGDDGQYEDNPKGLWSHGEAMGGDRFLALAPEQEWHDIVIHIVASGTGNGSYAVYLDGTLVDSKGKVSTIVPGKAYAYIKNGLYRNGGKIPGTSELLIDNAKLGTTLASVGGLGHP